MLGNFKRIFIAKITMCGLVFNIIPIVATSQDFEDFFDTIETSVTSNEFFGAELDSELNTSSKSYMSGAIIQNFSYGLENPSDYFLRNLSGIERINTNINIGVQVKPAENTKLKLSGVAEMEWGKFDRGLFDFNGAKIHTELRDSYFDLIFDTGLWVRAGNQIIARGELNSIIATDLINPRDTSRPGQSELEDIRRHVPAILISVPMSDITLEFIATLNAGSDKIAKNREAFDTKVLLGGQNIDAIYGAPTDSWEAMARTKFKVNGGDLALIIAQINWDQFSIKSSETFPSGQISKVGYGFDRVRVLGLSGNLARDNYLFKYELAYHSGVSLAKTNNFLMPWHPHNKIISALGLEYTGINDIVFGVEINNASISDYDSSLYADKNESGFLIQARFNTLNNLLSVGAVYSRFTGDLSSLSTVTADYSFNDYLTLGGRMVFYNSKKPEDFLFPYDEQDVANLSITYSF